MVKAFSATVIWVRHDGCVVLQTKLPRTGGLAQVFWRAPCLGECQIVQSITSTRSWSEVLVGDLPSRRSDKSALLLCVDLGAGIQASWVVVVSPCRVDSHLVGDVHHPCA
jgi:hypothetical protein